MVWTQNSLTSWVMDSQSQLQVRSWLASQKAEIAPIFAGLHLPGDVHVIPASFVHPHLCYCQHRRWVPSTVLYCLARTEIWAAAIHHLFPLHLQTQKWRKQSPCQHSFSDFRGMKPENIQSHYGASFCPAFCLLYFPNSEDFLYATAGSYPVLYRTLEVTEGINTLFHKTLCDRCTWNLDQASSILVKAWAVARPRSLLVSICSLKTHQGAEWHCDHQYTGAWNIGHACNTRIAGNFSKNHVSSNRGSCGSQGASCKRSLTFPIACNLTARQWFYPKRAFL